MTGRGTHPSRPTRWPGPLPLLSLVLVLVGAALPATARAEHWAPPRTVYLPSTGHTADGLFLEAWRDHSGIFGDPITEEFLVKTGYAADAESEQTVQYYQNTALVYLPDAAAGARVQVLDLGRQAYEATRTERPSRALQAAARRTACGPSASDCVGFAETGHTVRGAFRAFWREADQERWLGLPLTEAYRAADGSWLQYFENGALRLQGGVVAPLPLGTAAAARLGLATERVERPHEVPMYDEALFVAPPEPEPVAQPELVPAPSPAPDPAPAQEPVLTPGSEPDSGDDPTLGTELLVTPWSVGSYGPGPQQGAYQEIVVSLSQQAMWAYEGGEVVVSSLVSTGTAEVVETTTPIGRWSILTKYEIQDMQGTISNEDYFVPDVPDVMYFDDLGNALHGTYWHTNFGTPMSHGCVNLPLEVAAWLYDWAPIGTAVTVIP